MRESSLLKSLIAAFTVAVAALMASPLEAAVDDPVELLPRSFAVTGWAVEGPEAYYYDFSLERILDLEVEDVVKDYGFVCLLSQYYVNEMMNIEVRIYQMADDQQAFGLYSVFGDIVPEPEEGEIIFDDFEMEVGQSTTPEMRWMGAKELQLLGDNFFVQLIADEEGFDIDLMLFASKIKAKFDVSGNVLENDEPLKREDMIYGTQRLIGGYNALNLYLRMGNFSPFLLEGEGVRCMLADYRLRQGEAYRQLVVEYPDEEIAGDAYVAFRDWVDDFYYYRRLNVVDAIGSIYAVDEDETYSAGFRDGLNLRLFFGFDELDDLRDVVDDYRGKG